MKCCGWEGDPLPALKEFLCHSASRAGARDWHLGEILCYKWAEVGEVHFKCVSLSSWAVLFGYAKVELGRKVVLFPVNFFHGNCRNTPGVKWFAELPIATLMLLYAVYQGHGL